MIIRLESEISKRSFIFWYYVAYAFFRSVLDLFCSIFATVSTGDA